MTKESNKILNTPTANIGTNIRDLLKSKGVDDENIINKFCEAVGGNLDHDLTVAELTALRKALGIELVADVEPENNTHSSDTENKENEDKENNIDSSDTENKENEEKDQEELKAEKKSKNIITNVNNQYLIDYAKSIIEYNYKRALFIEEVERIKNKAEETKNTDQSDKINEAGGKANEEKTVLQTAIIDAWNSTTDKDKKFDSKTFVDKLLEQEGFKGFIVEKDAEKVKEYMKAALARVERNKKIAIGTSAAAMTILLAAVVGALAITFGLVTLPSLAILGVAVTSSLATNALAGTAVVAAGAAVLSGVCYSKYNQITANHPNMTDYTLKALSKYQDKSVMENAIAQAKSFRESLNGNKEGAITK